MARPFSGALKKAPWTVPRGEARGRPQSLRGAHANKAAVTEVPQSEAQAHDGRAGDVRLGLAWLVRVRYGAVGLFALALVVGRFALGLEVQTGWTVALLGLTLLSNLVLSSMQARAHRLMLSLVLAFDVATLASVLLLSGGAANPFSVFFLVHVALAAVLLTPALAWAFVLLTVLAFGSLFLVPMPGHHHHEGSAFSAHLLGMWIAYALSAAFVAYFVGRVSRAVRQLDREAAELRILALQNERLATLTSFSATAAHELASPLSTIALAAEELENAASTLPQDSDLRGDVALIRREIRRCRDILQELSSRAGESMGEMPTRGTLGEIVDRLLSQLSPRLAARLRVEFSDSALRELPLVTTKQTLVYLLHGLVRNAFEAEDDAEVDGHVSLVVDRGDLLRFRVLDRGPGVESAVLERIGEPFVTTKSDRGGLGLGLFLARAFAERAGGGFVLRARAGGGTEAELSLSERAFLAWETS